VTTSNAKIYPLEIKLHQSSNLLEIKFNNLTECMLSCEFLRVHSPSAEVRGHGHNTGIYTWDYLYELAATYDALWEEYLRKLSLAGIQRTKTHA
jgi:DUF971 family protein